MCRHAPAGVTRSTHCKSIRTRRQWGFAQTHSFAVKQLNPPSSSATQSNTPPPSKPAQLTLLQFATCASDVPHGAHHGCPRVLRQLHPSDHVGVCTFPRRTGGMEMHRVDSNLLGSHWPRRATSVRSTIGVLWQSEE